jgi:hypothetical protein
MRFFDGPSTSSPEIIMSDLGVTTLLEDGFGATELMGDAITATQQYLTVTFYADNVTFPGEYWEGYESVISCAVPFAGSTGRQAQTTVNNRKSRTPTEAQITERKVRAKEIKMRGNN